MKKSIQYFGYLLLIALFSSCEREYAVPELVEPAGIGFTVTIPDSKTVTTRAENITAGMIEDMQVLLFDPNGNFILRAEAQQNGAPGKYKVNLPAADPNKGNAENKRIIHFVCNCTHWPFTEVTAKGKSEKEIIPQLATDGSRIAYWQRVELPEGIDAETFPTTVSLRRSTAEVELRNNSANFSNVVFTIGQYCDRGTVAPFNSTTRLFDEDFVTESSDAILLPAVESAFKPVGSVITVYEQNNSVLDMPSYVILKGIYGGMSYYYKVDIKNTSTGFLFDIMRNHRYILTILDVRGVGHATLQDAIDNPASNNLTSSVLVQEYTTISDGQSALYVEKTYYTLVAPNKAFTFRYSYVPDISTGTLDNSLVNVSLIQDDLLPVVSGELSTDTGTTAEPDLGHIHGMTAPALPQFGVNTATIVVRAGDLQRTINLRLRSPSEFENIYTSPNPIGTNYNQPVKLYFTIPTGISAANFPMDIYITTTQLAPDKANSNLVLDTSIPGKYRYKYTANASGQQQVNFVTNTAMTEEIITLEGDLFMPARVHISSTESSKQYLTSLTCSPNGMYLPAGFGQPVEVSFQIGNMTGSNILLDIGTTKLTFVSSGTGTAVATANGYQYTAFSSGPQVLKFVTKEANSNETLTVGGSLFYTESYVRTCHTYAFTDVFSQPASATTGQAVNIQFSIPDHFAMNTGLDVMIYTTHLIPADGNPSNLVPASDANGSGYKYTATSTGSQIVHFKASGSYSANEVTLSAEAFASYKLANTDLFEFINPAFLYSIPAELSRSSSISLAFTVPDGAIPSPDKLTIYISGNAINTDNMACTERPSGSTVSYALSGDGKSAIVYVDKPGRYVISALTASSYNSLAVQLSAGNFITSRNLNVR